MPDKIYGTESLNAARTWVDNRYQVHARSVTPQLRNDLVNGLNDAQMDAMWARHQNSDKIVILFNDENVDMGTIVKKLGFRNNQTNQVQDFAQLSEVNRTWWFNYNL